MCRNFLCFVSRQSWFYGLQITNGRFWALTCRRTHEAGQLISITALFFGFHHSVISRSWKQFLTYQTIVQIPVIGCSRISSLVVDRYIAVVVKRNGRATTTHVTSMVSAHIRKTISVITVQRKLHMSKLYDRVPQVCCPLSVQSREARLKWCRELINWTVSDWGEVLFTDESKFAMQPYDKSVGVWREVRTRNQPQNTTEHDAFRGQIITV